MLELFEKFADTDAGKRAVTESYWLSFIVVVLSSDGLRLAADFPAVAVCCAARARVGFDSLSVEAKGEQVLAAVEDASMSFDSLLAVRVHVFRVAGSLFRVCCGRYMRRQSCGTSTPSCSRTPLPACQRMLQYVLA